MTEPGRIGALTGLRFPAALGVALCHLWYIADHPALPKLVKALMREGHLGVPFFFCLSGFLLAHAYRHRLRRGQIAKYLGARAARIGPLHVLILALAVLFPFSPFRPEWWQIGLQLFLLQIWVPDMETAQGANPVTWTLAVEAFLYLSLPLWIAAARRFTARSPAFWLGFALALCILQATIVWLFAEPMGEMGLWLFLRMPPIHLFEFGAGVALAYAYEGLRERGWASAATSRSRNWGTACEAGAVGLLVAVMVYNGKFSPHVRMSGLYTFPVGLIVLTFALGRGRLSQWFSSRPLVFLGEASFAFYLVHGSVFVHLYHAMPDTDPFVMAGMSLVAAMAVASGLFAFFEKPVRRWLLKPRSAPVPLPQPAGQPVRRAA